MQRAALAKFPIMHLFCEGEDDEDEAGGGGSCRTRASERIVFCRRANRKRLNHSWPEVGQTAGDQPGMTTTRTPVMVKTPVMMTENQNSSKSRPAHYLHFTLPLDNGAEMMGR